MKFNLRTILVLYSLYSAQIIVVDANQSHSVIWGTRSNADYMLQRAIITEGAKPMRVAELEYEIDLRLLQLRITQIVITNQIKNGNGGFVNLISGGPGRDVANLRFTSQLGKGFSFSVEVYVV